MSDESSERLAPVTYLPWAKEASAPEARGSRRRQSPSGGSAGSSGSGGLRSIGRDRSSPADEAGEAAARIDEAPDETGAERDQRIDRLVVSRLRRSALSESEVRAVLVEHGLDDVEVEEWIARYERLGYLDDARLAEQLVHSHGVRRGRGSGAILQELGRRGVDNTLARAAVEDLDPETELENARVVAERRARQLRGLDRQTAERRLSAFLQRRGYPGDIVREVVTAALAGEGS
ncbi:RecX family transcriptional regulator [Agromyces badenianii]|uniref:Regulatory protein RecX n=1 Tax=Agromyces badenianii TaxID=2080742 RepID=A0A2S0WV59_9MICO|nr:regulatory protein RecX [Agromyces badenianii]AWB95212.1 RecX family transcriptional regulator [Agromyces badenianii]PWC03289.1 RecX family transcriptional regulator [Agromyces badenianii]